MSNITNLKIEGMTCGHCVRGVTEALEAVPGVQAAKVELEGGTAAVTHDESVTLTALTDAVVEEGYAVR